MASSIKILRDFNAAEVPCEPPNDARYRDIPLPARPSIIAAHLAKPWCPLIAFLTPHWVSRNHFAYKPARSEQCFGSPEQRSAMDEAAHESSERLANYARRPQSKNDLVGWNWFCANTGTFPVLPLKHVWPFKTEADESKRERLFYACVMLDEHGDTRELDRLLLKENFDPEATDILRTLFTRFGVDPSEQEKFFAAREFDRQSAYDNIYCSWSLRREAKRPVSALWRDHGLSAVRLVKLTSKHAHWTWLLRTRWRPKTATPSITSPLNGGVCSIASTRLP